MVEPQILPKVAHYRPPARVWSGRLRSPDYPDDALVRQVRGSGEIKWRGGLVFLSQTLSGEPVGISEIDDGRWVVHYGPLELGTIDAGGEFARRAAGACPRGSAQPNPARESVTDVPG